MKRAFSLVVVLAVLCLPVKAGDTNGPPKSEPPPCTENCVLAAPEPEPDPSLLPTWLVNAIVDVIEVLAVP